MNSVGRRFCFLAVLLLLLACVNAKKDSLGNILHSLEEEPTRLISNIVFVIVLLVLGGVFAGKPAHFCFGTHT